jgi:organic radical activating enzyme
MNDLKQIINRRSYDTFAGPDWPSYTDLLQGSRGQGPIQQEVDQFVIMMRQTHNELTQSGDAIALDNQQRQEQKFYDKKLEGHAYCRVPWNTMGVNSRGDIFICSSPSWIPKFVGNILEVKDVFHALNSDIASNIRQEILTGRYYYCNNRICSFFGSIDPKTYNTDESVGVSALPASNDTNLYVQEIPRNLIFDFDYTCNYQCPSCRKEVINWNSDSTFAPINDRIVERIKHQVIDRIGAQPVNIRWAGGEPFISRAYMELLEYIIAAGKTNITNVIQTNGSYLKSKSDVLARLAPYIQELRISFDAATATTYSQVRKNGVWSNLIHNVRHAQHVLGSNRITADFVVQADNYQEIPLFVDLCRDLGIQRINWQKMWNWGTWSQAEFDTKNIYDKSHPDYDKLVKIFAQAGQRIQH